MYRRDRSISLGAVAPINSLFHVQFSAALEFQQTANYLTSSIEQAFCSCFLLSMFMKTLSKLLLVTEQFKASKVNPKLKRLSTLLTPLSSNLMCRFVTMSLRFSSIIRLSLFMQDSFSATIGAALFPSNNGSLLALCFYQSNISFIILYRNLSFDLFKLAHLDLPDHPLGELLVILSRC